MKRLFLRLKCFRLQFSIRDKRQINNIQLQTIKEKTCLTSHRSPCLVFLLSSRYCCRFGLAGNKKKSGATTVCVWYVINSSIISNTKQWPFFGEREREGKSKEGLLVCKRWQKEKTKEEKKKGIFFFFRVYTRKRRHGVHGGSNHSDKRTLFHSVRYSRDWTWNFVVVFVCTCARFFCSWWTTSWKTPKTQCVHQMRERERKVVKITQFHSLDPINSCPNWAITISLWHHHHRGLVANVIRVERHTINAVGNTNPKGCFSFPDVVGKCWDPTRTTTTPSSSNPTATAACNNHQNIIIIIKSHRKQQQTNDQNGACAMTYT